MTNTKRNMIVGGLAGLVLGSAVAAWEWNNLHSNPEKEQTEEEYNARTYHQVFLVGGAALALGGALATYAASTDGKQANYK